MAKKRYYQIWEFMTEDLNLKKNELLVYALIYSFTRRKNTKFNGSVAYIASKTNASVRDVKYSIASLKEKGLLKVVKINATRCEYYAVTPEEAKKLTSAKNAPINAAETSAKIAPFSKKQTGAKIAPQLVQKLHSTGAKIAPNNKKINKTDKYIDRQTINTSNSESEQKKAVCLSEKNNNIPTLDEVKAYCEEHGFFIDPVKFYEKNKERGWITKTGQPIKRWKALLWSWSENEDTKKTDKNSFMHTQYNFDEIEQNLLRN
jgi:DNA-binding MarR family transcriptional regulator